MDGGRTTKRQYSEYSDFFLHNENQSTIKIQTYISGSPPKSDGQDETGDTSRILVWVTPKTTGRGGHMKIASSRTQPVSGQNSRRTANVEREVGLPAIGYLKRRVDTETVGGISHGRRALSTSDAPDSTTSGSDIPEGHADRPPEVE